MQARLLISDYLEDLAEFTIEQLQRAVVDYRRDGKNKFFPKIGELRDLISPPRETQWHPPGYTGRKAMLEFGDPRPLCWEMRPRRLWAKHWRVEDLDLARDPDRKARYLKWVAAMAAKGESSDAT